MSNNHCALIMQNAPWAYAYHQVIYNDAGVAIDYKFIDVNAAFEKLTGLKGSQLLGKRVTTVLPQLVKDNFNWIKYYGNIAHRGSRAEFTHYFEALQRWLKINVFAPAPGCFVTIIADVTAQQRAQKQLLAKSTELERFFTLVPDLLFIADTEGYLHRLNNAWCKLLGYDIEDLFINKYSSFVHPRDSKKTATMWEKLARRKKVIDFVNRYRCADGSYRYLSWRATAKDEKVYGVARDITAIKEAQAKTATSEQLLKVTLHSICDGVITTDAAGNISMMNVTAARLTGWQATAAKGRHFTSVFNLVDEATGRDLLPTIESVLKGLKNKEFFENSLLVTSQRQQRFVQGNVARIKNRHRQVLGLIIVFRDVTAEKERTQEISYLSYHDKLTGLYNRAFFEEQLKRLDHPRQRPLALIMGDVNGLKLANDIFGHQYGDRLLIEIANILTQHCRTEDILARWAGDEFVMLLPQTTQPAAQAICRRIEGACTEASDDTMQLSIALGCATKTRDDENINDVLAKAENFMYRHKLITGRKLRQLLFESLKKIVYQKGHETATHAGRLGDHSAALGRHRGLHANEIEELRLLAAVHDIGLINVDEGILTQPGPLTADQWDEMKKHPEVGYRIANSIPGLAAIADYVLAHHERWDGQGYPQGLQGQAIPLPARILAVADAYDAMTQPRPYRPLLTQDEAVTELLAQAGSQFDPQLVDIFIRQVLGGVAIRR